MVIHVLNMVDHGLTDLVTGVIRSKSSENAENTVFEGPGDLEKCELYQLIRQKFQALCHCKIYHKFKRLVHLTS